MSGETKEPQIEAFWLLRAGKFFWINNWGPLSWDLWTLSLIILLLWLPLFFSSV